MNFDQIYQTYYPELLQFARFMTNHREWGAEIVQESFVKLFEASRRGEYVENPRAWLYRVVRNHCINHNQRNRLVLSDDQAIYDGVQQADYADSEMLNERQRQLKRTISELPRQEQMMLFLYRKQFSYKEMAEVLQMNPNSVGKTLSRIIQKVTQKIKEVNHELFEN